METVAIELENRSRFLISVPNEITRWRVDTFWDKEPNTLEWIETFKPDDLFLDIGANIGLYSLYAAFSRGVDVVAFEPESLNYALLNRNIFTNQIDRKIKSYCLALSDEVAMNAIHLSMFDEGAASHNFKEKINFKHEPLQPEFSQGCFSVSLDSLIAQALIPVPQHIKIDVDGMEHKILEGAKYTLERPELLSVLVELNTNLSSHRQVVDLMSQNGFIYSERQVKDELSRSDGPFQGIGNFIFFKKPKSEWERLFSYASKV